MQIIRRGTPHECVDPEVIAPELIKIPMWNIFLLMVTVSADVNDPDGKTDAEKEDILVRDYKTRVQHFWDSDALEGELKESFGEEAGLLEVFCTKLEYEFITEDTIRGGVTIKVFRHERMH